MATTTEKIQTLRCQHGEGHDWTRPSQRGKPPNFCPEHRDLGVMQRDMERKQAQGIRAIGGDPKAIGLETKVDQAQAEIDALDREQRDNLRKAREAAAKAREERKARTAEQEIQARRDELQRIISNMPEVEQAYESAFDKANRSNKVEDWHVADAAQSRIIGMITRRRALQRAA